jgi:hypothetical protein
MIKIKQCKIAEKYGKEYDIEYRHRIWSWNKYKIKYKIDNDKYNIKQYNKERS